MCYKNPEEGARLMFETIKHYFEKVLFATPAKKLNPLDQERQQHDIYLVSRLALGNVFVGGDKFLKQLDNFASGSSEGTGTNQALAIVGGGGIKFPLLVCLKNLLQLFD